MKAQNAILGLFKRNPHAELSTSEIVENIEKNKILGIEEILKQKYSDKEQIKKAKREKAQLHRKTLYHLNELVDRSILRVKKEGKKGTKYFELDIEEGEELSIDSVKKKSIITISKPKQSPSLPIEGYEQKGIIHRLEPATWIERLNSILIECQRFDDLKELLHFISTCFSNVNDVIALNDFELLFHKYDSERMENFINKLNSRCSDYGKRICCIFDMTNFKNEEEVIKFLKNYQHSKHKNISFIFDTKVREFQEHSLFFEKIIKIMEDKEDYLYIKNQDLHEAPYLIGRGGPYAFDENEWRRYKKDLQKKMHCLICAHSSIMVDGQRFFEEYKRDPEEFRKFNMKVAHALLNANSIQRRRAEELFSDLILLNEPYVKDLFIFSKNYIRFWNYGWKREDFDQDFLIDMLKKSKDSIDRFCLSQETIYNSCGMPTRFRIAFSFAFESFVKDIFSKSLFKKFVISGIKDFYKEDIKKILEDKERLFGVFDGGDMITFNRIGKIDSKDIIREISFIMNTYKIPFFRWKFGDVKGKDLSLGRFI